MFPVSRPDGIEPQESNTGVIQIIRPLNEDLVSVQSSLTFQCPVLATFKSSRKRSQIA